MRTVGFSLVLIAVCVCVLGCPATRGGGGLRSVCPTLTNQNGTPYTAVTGAVSAGHCDFTWHVDDTTLDATGHPEVYLDAGRGDTMTFDGGSGFIYSISPNAPNGVDESKCFASPVSDAQAGQSLNHHNAGKVQRNGHGPAQCHYNIKFTKGAQGAKTAEVDPHIVVGGGRM